MKILSICIPTYNRAQKLEKLLNTVLPQVNEFKDSIEVCISNNGSTDNTKTVVKQADAKYPGIIRYSENLSNVGFDRNLLKVTDLATGHFVWLFGDDDSIVENGVQVVLGFVEKSDFKNTGLIMLRRESFYFDEASKKRVIHSSSFDEKKPPQFEMDINELIAGVFEDDSFISVMLINNDLLSDLKQNDLEIIEKGLQTLYIHKLLYKLIFLKFPNAKAFTLNKIVVMQEMPDLKLYVEDEFEFFLRGGKIEEILESTKYSAAFQKASMRKGASVTAKMLSWKKKGLPLDFMSTLAFMRAFGVFNYDNYSQCLRLFRSKLSRSEGTVLSLYFIGISKIPVVILKNALMGLLKIFQSDWKKTWLNLSSTFTVYSKGKQRRLR